MMRSTFAGFTTASLALSASHRALEVTGQNIANVNTPGYTRQRLDIASLNLKSGDFYNSNPNAQIGFGVDIKGVSRIRDPFLDIQYRMQMSKLGTSDAQLSGYEKLANILDETMLSGVRDAFKDLNSQLQSLHANASEKEHDSMVRSSAQNLLNLFHQSATRLEEVREDLANEFRDTTVKDLNGILKNIAELNETIKNSHILGNPALELMDQRDTLIDELSSYLPITTEYKDQALAPGVTVEILNINFVDEAGNKYRLVADNDYGELYADTTDTHNVTLSISDARLKKGELTSDKLQNGVLKGTMDMLNKSGGFDNTDVRGIGYYEKSLDAMVSELANMFNELNAAVKTDADGVVQFGTATYEKATGTVAGPPFTINGEAAYVRTVDPTTKEISYTAATQADIDAKKDLYIEKKDAAGNSIPGPIFIDRPLFTTMDGQTTGFTAANITIAKEWNTGEYGITTSTVPVYEDGNQVIGSKANENVLKMIEALNGTRNFKGGPKNTEFFQGSFYDCYTNMENVLAIDQKETDNTLTNKITVINQTADLRDSVSGVSLDEEGINLLQYQQSYTAAARLMTTLDEALDKLINGTGVVGR
ncbi:MAG: flagellar hook-associated protein FlgK [Lachnospiraceae bacterium]|nr:flagellar hook-associated protein FlgK [Lachnospiraceae bacterium]